MGSFIRDALVRSERCPGRKRSNQEAECTSARIRVSRHHGFGGAARLFHVRRRLICWAGTGLWGGRMKLGRIWPLGGIWKAVGTALIVLFFASPLLSGLVNRIADRDAFSMPDYGAVACAAERLVSDQPLYVPGQRRNCEDYISPPYLYPPLLAGLEAGVQATFGVEGARLFYLALYLTALAFITWRIFLAGGAPGRRMDRLPYLALIPATPIWQANVATVAHAGVLFASSAAWRTPWVFAAAVVLLSAVKPSFLAYLLVLACLPFPIWRRLLLTIIPLALIGAGIAAFLSGPAEAEIWRESLRHVMLEWVPGNGSLGIAARLGAPGGPALVFAVLFAGLIALAALVICEAGEADVNQRIFIAISAAVIAMPRIMPYDVFLIAPGMVAAVQVVSAARPRAGKLAGRLAMTGCIVAALMSLAGYANQRLDAALLFFSAALVVGAVTLAPRHPIQFVIEAERRALRYRGMRN